MLILYLFLCIPACMIAYRTVDPYEHMPPWKRWALIAFVTFLWPVLLVYFIAMYLYYDYWEKK